MAHIDGGRFDSRGIAAKKREGDPRIHHPQDIEKRGGGRGKEEMKGIPGRSR